MYIHTYIIYIYIYIYIYICVITVIINVGMEVCNLFMCKVFCRLSKIRDCVFLALLVIKFVNFFKICHELISYVFIFL